MKNKTCPQVQTAVVNFKGAVQMWGGSIRGPTGAKLAPPVNVLTPSFTTLERSLNILDPNYLNYVNDDTDMEKDQIFLRTRFVNNQNFRKKYISKFITIT